MADHARLFIAIRFPGSVRRSIWDAMAPLRDTGADVRWTPVGQLHITLRFLGDVPAESIGAIDESLSEAAAGCERFTLPLGGVGAFPSLRRPRVLWVGGESGPGLSALYAAVEAALQRCGFEPEGRRFRPHVTLGRIRSRGRRSASPAESAALARIAGAIGFRAALEVDHLHLMRSRLSPTGAEHTVVGEYTLGKRGR